MSVHQKRTIFIGDVQGCYHELCELLEKLKLSTNDRVILLGDLINRGPDAAGVLKLVYTRKYESLLGNQEAAYLKYYQDVLKYHDLYQKIGPEIHTWIKSLPLFIETEKFIAVHAGLEPGKPPAQCCRRVLLSIRTWDGKGKDLHNNDDPPWYLFYKGKKPVIYGHWAEQGLTLRRKTKGLDSGCVYGGALSAYVLETGALVQVQAKRVYYNPWG